MIPLDLHSIIMLVLGIAILIVGVLVIRSGRPAPAERKAAGNIELSAHAPAEPARAKESHADLARREAELQEKIGQLLKQLESKTGELRRAIREAEQSIARLEKGMAQRAKAEASDDAELPPTVESIRPDASEPKPKGPHRVSATDIQEWMADNSRAAVGRSGVGAAQAAEPESTPDERPRTVATATKTKAAGKRGATRAAATAKSAHPPEQPGERFNEIYLLADYGYPPEKIAEHTSVPIGEVELILSLRGDR